MRTQAAAGQTHKRLRQHATEVGLSDDQLHNLLTLANRAYRTALVSAHYEDLRAILNSWRYFHRWVALFMVLLVVVHVYIAFRYGRIIP